jgi:Spy/CpxP family protein refolding chaperone
MKPKLVVAAVAAILATAAWAQVGPGMMGGYGPGDCGYGPGYGMGPGMMGGGMGGYGMGSGMMGGYGPGGYGMGPGMMGGNGPGAYFGLKLSDEQQRKIADIQEEQWRKQWALMNSMHELRFKELRAEQSGKADDAEARKTYQAMADLRKQMFENSLDTRKRINSVLTKEQREQLQQGWRGRGGYR